MSRFFPLGLDLEGAVCAVVGGGRIGTRKAETLLAAGARVRVISPRVSARLAELHDGSTLQWLAEPFRPQLLEGALLVVAAADRPAVNEAVVGAARELGILVCDASSAERSQFIFGALHRAEQITLAVFTNGQDPALARRTRDRVAAQAGAALRPRSRQAETRGAVGEASQLIVVAHGSRDPRWRASIERVVQAVQADLGQAGVALAYMDRASPTLLEAVADAVRAGRSRLQVLPLFLAPEGHVDRDIRPWVERARAAHPDISIEFLPPIGQLPGFQELLCNLALAAARAVAPVPATSGNRPPDGEGPG